MHGAGRVQLIRSEYFSGKQFKITVTDLVSLPDKIYDTYVDINKMLQLDQNIYNALLAEAKY